MENGLQIFIEQNIDMVKTLVYSVLVFLISVIGLGFIGIARLSYKIYNNQNESNNKRLETGETRFQKIENGLDRIEDQIERKEETAEIQRQEIKDSVGAVEGRLSDLEREHKGNHKDK